MLKRIIYFGKGPRGEVCAEALRKENVEFVGLVLEDPSSRLLEFGGAETIPVLKGSDINSPESIEWLGDRDPDLFVLSGYSKILSEEVLDIPRIGCLNLHGGKLPEYRGAAPINWQIINGETKGGCCIIELDEGIDTGPILKQEYYDIHEDDDHYTVLEKTLAIFPRLLCAVVRDLESHFENKQVQDPMEGAFYTRRYPDDSRIDWRGMTDMEVYNLVRAMHGPYQWAFTYRASQMIEVAQARVLEETVYGVPGRVARRSGEGRIVMCKNRGIVLEKVRIEGTELPGESALTYGDKLP